MAFLKHEIMQRAKPSIKEVELEHLGGSIHIKELSGAKGEELARLSRDKPSEFILQLVFDSVCNPDGTPMFSDGDRDEVMRWPLRVIQEISGAAIELNGLDEEIAVIEGNSGGTPAGGSGSTSQPN